MVKKTKLIYPERLLIPVTREQKAALMRLAGKRGAAAIIRNLIDQYIEREITNGSRVSPIPGRDD